MSFDNVLLQSKRGTSRGFVAKLAGLSRVAAVDGGDLSQVGAVAAADQARYAAPEVLHDHVVSRKSDMWSFGVVLWELWGGVPPWAGLGLEEVVDRVVSASYQLPIPLEWPRAVRELLEDCWKPDPGMRPTMARVVERV